MNFCFIQICKTAPSGRGVPPCLLWHPCLWLATWPTSLQPEERCGLSHKSFLWHQPFLFLSLPTHWPSVVGNVESTGYSSISLLLCMERRWIFCAYLYSYFLGSVNSLTLLSCPVLHRSCCRKGATTFTKSGSVIGLLSGFPIFR